MARTRIKWQLCSFVSHEKNCQIIRCYRHGSIWSRQFLHHVQQNSCRKILIINLRNYSLHVMWSQRHQKNYWRIHWMQSRRNLQRWNVDCWRSRMFGSLRQCPHDLSKQPMGLRRFDSWKHHQIVRRFKEWKREKRTPNSQNECRRTWRKNFPGG